MLRRMREHIVHHNWFAVAIDFIIVVAGVFLGIQASNWNQARLNRQQASEYRKMLRSDLDANMANLENRRRYYEWVRGEGLATLSALNRPSTGLGEQFLIDAYQTSQMQPWAPKRTTYDQIVSAGVMADLGPPALRDEIANYYVGTEIAGFNVAALPPYRDIVRRVMPYAIQERIRARCNEKVVATSTGASRIILPGRCTLGLDPATIRQAVRQVHDWPGLALDINRWLVDLDQKLLSVRALSDRANALKAHLVRQDA